MKNFILSILTFIGLATAGKPISEGQPAYNFSLTADPKGEVAKAYDVPLIFGLCSRNTVIINPEGKVEKIYRGVDPSADAKNVLKLH